MKSILQKLSLAIFAGTFAFTANAQTTDTVTVNPGYTNQTFYSFANGTVSSVSNLDWDLAFQLRGYAASILINSKNNVRLYKANKSTADWSSMTTADTTGVLSTPSNELFNSDTSWDFGAFNVTNNPADMFDLGWGNYDFMTHAITGDSVYYIKLSSGTYKKLCIVSLANSVYDFKWADLDGSNETLGSINKTTYAGKNFVYFSIANNLTIDREPAYNAWDLSFAQYLTTTPIVYKVSGVLTNDSVFAVKAYPVDVNNVSASSYTFNSAINNIGYDWKSFNMTTNTYDIVDSTVYFVQDRQGSVWKMIFTGFGGGANGNFYFYKGTTTGIGQIENSSIKTFDAAPNPAHGSTRLILSSEKAGDTTMQVISMNGMLMSSDVIQLNNGLQSVDLSLEALTPGIYQVLITMGNERQITRIVVQ
ncbi:MAG: T9SS type A sorting domain-containing protein [Bacteroidota bacterium]